MTTDERFAQLNADPEFAHLPGWDVVIQCVTDQGNHPFAKETPFARPLDSSETRGLCAVCGQEVDVVRYREDNPSLYCFTAEPHTRIRRHFVVTDDELDRLVSVIEHEYGSLR